MRLWRLGSLFARAICIVSIATTFDLATSAQKIKTGFDKAADFSRFKTYAWAGLNREPGRPLLFQLIVGNVDYELNAKGLKRVDSKPDLLLFPAGGFDSTFALSGGAPISNYLDVPLSVSTASWVGPLAWTGGGVSPMVHTGTLMIDLVERETGKLVWEGSVSEEFDFEKKKESVARLEKCIAKLFKDFPPDND